MDALPGGTPAPIAWEPSEEPPGRFSSGIPELDRRLGGGFRCGSFALFELDPGVTVPDLDLVLRPLYLNFLGRSRGILAVLPASDTPHEFRLRLTEHASPERFDRRVRIVEYARRSVDRPYVVNLAGLFDGPSPAEQRRGIARMVESDRAVRGPRGGPILEVYGFDAMEAAFGAERAARMFLLGAGRSREAGNLVVGLLAPGLASAGSVRPAADTVLRLSHGGAGLELRGEAPAFPPHGVVRDPARGAPHVALIPLG